MCIRFTKVLDVVHTHTHTHLKVNTQPYGSGVWGPAIVVLFLPFLKNSLVGSIVPLLKIPHRGAPVSPHSHTYADSYPAALSTVRRQNTKDVVSL